MNQLIDQQPIDYGHEDTSGDCTDASPADNGTLTMKQLTKWIALQIKQTRHEQMSTQTIYRTV